ncbi:MAG: extracellular solute-binding protein [Candidatus Moranbacteria bacterium]|nr:extracellular solute-binding protein [Candidatus Moranbacteria bacterium]
MSSSIFFRLFTTSFLLLGVFVLSGCQIFRSQAEGYSVDLEIWGVFDDNTDYQGVVSEYKKANPFVRSITYRKFTIENYKRDLIDALAAGNGPDIFMINNTWVPQFQDKIEPAPTSLINEQLFRGVFVDVAADDLLVEGNVYAVPLSVDSLALYYNRDLFNAAGITAAPRTWDEFQSMVRLLTRFDSSGRITQSGAALGTAYNVNRSMDLLGLLFVQNGLEIVSPSGGEATFSNPTGREALDFYTQFADVRSPLYTWDRLQHYSIDAFFEGSLAMMINYSWHYETVVSKNEDLRFSVAPVPQLSLSRPANFANYWSYAVAKNKAPVGSENLTREARSFEAWEFLKYLTMPNGGVVTLTNALSGTTKNFSTSIDPARTYLERAKKPAARRDLVEEQKSDTVLGPFAFGNLIARTYYQSDPEAFEALFAQAIDDVNSGRATSNSALDVTENRMTQLLRR